MTLIRRAILAFALIAGITPAMAQIPPPVPALPDTERRTSYSISGSTCACSVGFQLYGDSTDYTNWLEVFVNGALVPQAGNWTLTSPTGPLSSIPRPITDAILTFTAAQTGTVQIVGARRPRRTSQFQTQPAARDFNVVLSDLTAQNREVWDKINDVTGRSVRTPPGETLALLPALASRANTGACFDSNGNLTSCVTPAGSFTAGNGITFTGSNPTTITSNIQAGAGINITGTNPYVITATITATGNRGYFSGFGHSNDITSPNTVIDFTVGTARDSTNAQTITQLSAFTKSTAAFAVGSGNGCLDTGTVAVNTWYYTYALLRTDLSSADYVCSVSPSAPTLSGGALTNYSFFRLIGMFKTATGTTNILPFTQVNDRWYWAAAIRETGATIACVTTPGLITTTVPRIQGISVIFNLLFFGSPTGISGGVFAPGFSPVVSTTQDGYSFTQNAANGGASGLFTIPVDSGARISFVCDNVGAGYVVNIYTKGWIFQP